MRGESLPRTSLKPLFIPRDYSAPICGALADVFRELRQKRRLSMFPDRNSLKCL